jgi:hypothetical protein
LSNKPSTQAPWWKRLRNRSRRIQGQTTSGDVVLHVSKQMMGTFVTYADYAALEAENRELKAQVDALSELVLTER